MTSTYAFCVIQLLSQTYLKILLSSIQAVQTHLNAYINDVSRKIVIFFQLSYLVNCRRNTLLQFVEKIEIPFHLFFINRIPVVKIIYKWILAAFAIAVFL